ncbi:EamA family transporter [Rhodocyclus tenuis]|uniref:DMT family transporter n=1 Tax=Rhodocyclus gracilis TaxID=2929842 RepID=UPI0012989AE8|nr:DMT family transporter [Rhodocyclus gracilis]MRD72092.1 EamA family transporter [Rhodocyclus gracilis]
MSHTHPATPLATWLKLLGTAFFWGGTWIAGRVAVREVTPLAAASWRFFVAALVLGLLVVAREGLPRWSRREWLLLAALGASGIFLYNICFLYGLQRIEAGRGALVVALTPAAVAAADWLFFGAPMSRLRATGILLAMLGCLVVVTHGDPLRLFAGEVGRGEWLIMGCVVLWAAYTFIGRRAAQTLSPLAMTFGASLTGWVMLTIAAAVDGSLLALDGAGWQGISSIVFLGLFGTVIGFTWYSEAVERLGATRASAFINLVPLFAVLLGALLLDERVGPAAIIGGVIAVAGVTLTNRATPQARRVAARAAHTPEKTA